MAHLSPSSGRKHIIHKVNENIFGHAKLATWGKGECCVVFNRLGRKGLSGELSTA